MMEAAADQLGPVSIIVCNAGIVRKAMPIEEISSETWQQVIGVNLKGVMLGTKHAIRTRSTSTSAPG